jgi:DNA-binding GntR family transcriptional regulator
MLRRHKAVEIISDLLQEAADSLRKNLEEAMHDDNRSSEEHEAIRKALERYPAELDAQARWWKTGEGPPP